MHQKGVNEVVRSPVTPPTSKLICTRLLLVLREQRRIVTTPFALSEVIAVPFHQPLLADAVLRSCEFNHSLSNL